MVNRAAEDTLQGKTNSHQVISSLLKKSMKKDQELIVITKTYAPQPPLRARRADRAKPLQPAETLIAAKYTKHRQRLLEEANLTLEVLRFQMRLAKDLQCLKVESYAFAAKSIDEIGDGCAPQSGRGRNDA